MTYFIKMENITVVDTRPTTMMIKYHIVNSMPYRKFLAFSEDEYDISNQKIVFVCSRGHKSYRLAEIFSRKTGLTTYSLDGGLTKFRRFYSDFVLIGGKNR
ncbi:rhodanese-like domain-containing protein [Oxyplasma meridianum]|uniref:Rhodanese-like domain-containing protein n=1 Tax=Oxyplasma meridianum TaxID=3073602 RepID=A0AAX4NFK8_9ARCH